MLGVKYIQSINNSFLKFYPTRSDFFSSATLQHFASTFHINLKVCHLLLGPLVNLCCLPQFLFLYSGPHTFPILCNGGNRVLCHDARRVYRVTMLFWAMNLDPGLWKLDPILAHLIGIHQEKREFLSGLYKYTAC